jgi:glutathione S-transferase
VLVCPEGQVVAESADIVAWADARGGRIDVGAEACTLAAMYDRDLGPATRLWVYHEMFDHPELVADAMTAGVPTWERYAYRFGNRALAFAVSRVLRINDATAVEAERTFRSIFASVDALLADGRPYLAGADFSIADLTFASLAAPLIAPPQYGVRLPPVEALPPGMVDVVREHRASAAGRHALRMFAEERGGERAPISRRHRHHEP